MDLTREVKCGGESRFLLVIVDVASRYPFICPLRRVSADAIVKALMQDVIPITGIPNCIQTDNERCFSGNELKMVRERLGIKKKEVAVYRPQAQGIVERTIRTLKTLAFENYTRKKGMSPAEVVFDIMDR
jgi:transposase InsO family protein